MSHWRPRTRQARDATGGRRRILLVVGFAELYPWEGGGGHFLGRIHTLLLHVCHGMIIVRMDPIVIPHGEISRPTSGAAGKHRHPMNRVVHHVNARSTGHRPNGSPGEFLPPRTHGRVRSNEVCTRYKSLLASLVADMVPVNHYRLPTSYEQALAVPLVRVVLLKDDHLPRVGKVRVGMGNGYHLRRRRGRRLLGMGSGGTGTGIGGVLEWINNTSIRAHHCRACRFRNWL